MIEKEILNEVKSFSNKPYAEHHARFFKTEKGGYGEGDLFYGLKVPQVRQIAKKHYKTIELNTVDKLIKNSYHEVRLLALIILAMKYSKANEKIKKQIFIMYLDNVNYINNWDLVDLSAYHIIGAYLYDKEKDKLWELANSKHLWSERISIISTNYFIKKNEYSYTLELSKHFLEHKHDLIHKATGWMLREVGKKDINTLYSFLDKYYKKMPRTMLRYSLEKMSKDKRIFYMTK